MAKFDNHMIFRIVLIVIAAFVLFALINYYNSKQTSSYPPNHKASFTNSQGNHVKNMNDPYKNKQPFENSQYDSQQTNSDSQMIHPTQSAPPFITTPAPKKTFMEPFTEGSSVNPSEEKGDELFRTVDFNSKQLSSDCFPKDRLTAEDLLPKDAANSKWSQVATNGQGELANQNFLTSGYHVGINSVSGSLRNANLQLRSEPPNPKLNISPWNASTITGDSGFRRPLEISGDC